MLFFPTGRSVNCCVISQSASSFAEPEVLFLLFNLKVHRHFVIDRPVTSKSCSWTKESKPIIAIMSSFRSSSTSTSGFEPRPRRVRIVNFLNKRLIVHTASGSFEGQLKAFDRHMNLVLQNTTEIRKINRRLPKSDDEDDEVEMIYQRIIERRELGMVVVRGNLVVTLEVLDRIDVPCKKE